MWLHVEEGGQEKGEVMTMQIIFLGLFLKKKNKKIVYTSIYPENNAFELSFEVL